MAKPSAQLFPLKDVRLHGPIVLAKPGSTDHLDGLFADDGCMEQVEHDLQGKGMETGIHNGRRWRHGAWIQYTLDPRGEKEVVLSVTYSGDDRGREFDILANGTRIATQKLTGEKPNGFIEKRYPIPSEVLQAAGNDRITVRFTVKQQLAGGLYDVRLLRPGTPEVLSFN